jgi:3-oxoacyl-[acyl-carrier-protein] synthase-3
MLFGDAGTATLLEWTDEENPAWFITGTRGKGWDKLIAPAGGYNLPVRADIADLEVQDARGDVWRLYDDIMKGIDIFKFTNDVGPKGIASILQFSGKTIDDVDYFALHQANKQIVRTVAAYANLPRETFSAATFSTYGNCGTAAVTLDLCNRLKDAPAKSVCLATFGVGLSWGFGLLDLSRTLCGGIRLYTTPPGKPSREEKVKYWIAYFKGENA